MCREFLSAEASRVSPDTTRLQKESIMKKWVRDILDGKPSKRRSAIRKRKFAVLEILCAYCDEWVKVGVFDEHMNRHEVYDPKFFAQFPHIDP